MNNLLSHLKERHLNLELYSHYLCDEGKTVTFPLWNLSGQMVGFQQYTPFQPKNDKSLKPRELRYYTLLTKTDNKLQMLGAFGLDLLNPEQKYVFVCEGVFDACRLHNRGLNALALLACDPKPLKSWLWSMGYVVVPVCEGDDAGQKLQKLANSDLVVYLPENKDLGDLTEEEVDKEFSFFL